MARTNCSTNHFLSQKKKTHTRNYFDGSLHSELLPLVIFQTKIITKWKRAWEVYIYIYVSNREFCLPKGSDKAVRGPLSEAQVSVSHIPQRLAIGIWHINNRELEIGILYCIGAYIMHADQQRLFCSQWSQRTMCFQVPTWSHAVN